MRPRRIAGALVLACLVPAASQAQSRPGPAPAASSTSTAAPQEPSPVGGLREVVAAATVDAPPATVIVSNREIVTLRATVALRAPAVRTAAAERLIADLVAQAASVSVTARALAGGQMIAVGTEDVLALVPADLDPADPATLADVAQRSAARLQQSLDEAIEVRSPRRLLVAGALSLLATIVMVVLLRLLVRGHASFLSRTTSAADRRLHRLSGTEWIRLSRIQEVLRHVVGTVTIALGVLLLYGWLTYVLRRFPYTRPWGEALRGFLVERVVAMGHNILNAIPDLFTVLLIVLITRFVVRISGFLFSAVERGQVKLSWVFPETVQPTRRLITAVLWLLALALAYPYLPGADTDAFKGVSVFIGLMISLGSSGVVNQLMSGMVLTYSRALRLGDFVRIGDVEGTVTHLGNVSLKITTLRREEVTIPNSVAASQQTTNYSRFAASEGVLAATAVTIGYDVPWRQVEALLLLAAARTEGIRRPPPPVVRQTGLRDFYVEYTLFVCLDDPALRLRTLDRLHGHIQDAFNEHGVQIMSPNYEADPDGPKVVPRDRWFASPAAPEAEQALRHKA